MLQRLCCASAPASQPQAGQSQQNAPRRGQHTCCPAQRGAHQAARAARVSLWTGAPFSRGAPLLYVAVGSNMPILFCAKSAKLSAPATPHARVDGGRGAESQDRTNAGDALWTPAATTHQRAGSSSPTLRRRRRAHSSADGRLRLQSAQRFRQRTTEQTCARSRARSQQPT
jgi:hypothetical protein